MELLSAGFAWAMPHPDALSTTDHAYRRYHGLVSASECWSLFLPGAWSYTWMGVDDDTRRRHARAMGVVDVEHAMRTVQDGMDAGALGFPNIIHDLDTAFRLQGLLQPGATPRLLELGVPRPLAESVLAETAPNPGMGTVGLHAALSQGQPLSPGTLLGYELVGIEHGGSLHSHACNALGPALADGFGVRPNRWGLIADADLALRCAAALTNEALPAAPLLWIPLGLSTPATAALPPIAAGDAGPAIPPPTPL